MSHPFEEDAGLRFSHESLIKQINHYKVCSSQFKQAAALSKKLPKNINKSKPVFSRIKRKSC